MVYIGIAVAEQVVHEQNAQIRGVDSIAALKALPVAARYGLVRTYGYYSAFDGGSDLWRWNATSTAAESDTVVRPDDLTATDPGRWERFELVTALVEAFGAGTGRSAATNRAALLRAFAEPGVHLVFGGVGDYLYDNSTTTIINNFEGRLTFNPKARLVFTDNLNDGIRFVGGTGAVFEKLNLTYSTLPTVRGLSWAPWYIYQTTGTVVDDYRADGSTAMGLMIEESIRPRVFKTRISNTMADGCGFANCEDSVIVGHNAYNTGDDALSFGRTQGDTRGGFYAAGIFIRESKTRGIAVVGQVNGVVEGFYINNTNEPGIIAFEDNSFNTDAPVNVRFAHGYVKNGGKRDAASLRHGIQLSQGTDVVLEDVLVDSPGARGVDAGLMNGALTVRNMRVRAVRGANSGFELAAPTLHVSDLVAEDCDSYGILLQNSAQIFYSNLTAIECSKTQAHRRAIAVSGDAVATRIQGSGLNIVDLQATPTGYAFHTWPGVGLSGSLGELRYIIPNGDLLIDNQAGLPLGSINGADTREMSANRGDANVILTASDVPVQRFDTALTANRTVTLPTASNYNGRWFKIVRRGLGAFTLNVGGLKSIPASTAAAVEVTHDGSAWGLTGYEVL